QSPTYQKRWQLAAQMALTALWRSWGLEPSCVLGQGAGLVGAAVTAGPGGGAGARGPVAGGARRLAWAGTRFGVVGGGGRGAAGGWGRGRGGGPACPWGTIPIVPGSQARWESCPTRPASRLFKSAAATW